MVVTDPDGEDVHKKASQVIVPLETDGVEFVEISQLWDILEQGGKAMLK